MSTDGWLIFEGTVLSTQRGDFYEVDCKAGVLRRNVLAKRSGHLVRSHIRLIAGDRIEVAVSPYDLSRGRITRRLKEHEAARSPASSVQTKHSSEAT